MSRSGYTEDDGDDPLAMGRWRGAVASAIRGKRGQAFLRELADALDAMPEKVLVSKELQSEDGCFCTLGVIGHKRGLDLASMDIDDYDAIAHSLGVNAKIAQEIMWENDESFSEWEWVDVVICGPMRQRYFVTGSGWYTEKHERSVRILRPGVDELRWKHMRAWVAEQLIKPDRATTEQSSAVHPGSQP